VIGTPKGWILVDPKKLDVPNIVRAAVKSKDFLAVRQLYGPCRLSSKKGGTRRSRPFPINFRVALHCLEVARGSLAVAALFQLVRHFLPFVEAVHARVLNR